MTKLDFHHLQVRHFNNVFELSWCHCRVGATPARRSNCLQTRRIHHRVKYRRLNANTCIVAAILFSGHPYIGRHYCATLIMIQMTIKGELRTLSAICDQKKKLPQRSEVKFEFVFLLKMILMSCSHYVPNFMLLS